jgi:hypothetical protein
MTVQRILPAIIIILAIVLGIFLFANTAASPNSNEPVVMPDALPKNVTLSGTYVCLPHATQGDFETQECAFGLKTDDGEYYAVNFGQSANSMELFQSGAHIVAEGFVVAKEALSSDHWKNYTMKGIFTTTTILETTPGSGSPANANPQ